MSDDESAREHVEYDPDQDPEEARSIRRQFRHLEQQLTDSQDLTTEEVAEKLRSANKLFKHGKLIFAAVQAINEATKDSNLLVRFSEISAAKARAMKSGSGAFDVDDFVARLITYMGGRKPVSPADDEDEDEEESEYHAGAPLDWERIGRRALAKSRRVPAMDFIRCGLHVRRLGPLSIEAKKRAVAKRAVLEKNKDDMKKPQEITEEDITRSENETTKNVATVEKILGAIEGQVNLFKFVINPNDFGQSVENLFYLSFLIRDGKCAFEIESETGEPVIMLCEQPTQEDYDDGLLKHQMVLEFDLETWQRAIEVFDIKEAMIPPRAKSEMRIGQKWYG
ncbi:Nse4 C-terminal-domain-containing protein [Trametes gibbosa]|nr:Nse4 C-terminal-domain-containing protein [Trametes gibbosa]